MYLLFFIAIVFNIFFNTVVPYSLGYEGVKTLSFLPILIYFIINLINKKIRYDKVAIYIILFAVIIFIFKWSIEQDYFHKVTLLMIIPMIVSMCFENLTKKELTLLRTITILFFITECSLSIIEWTLNHNFFISGDTEETDYWMSLGFFRSTSLLGHPLGNAQIVAVFMAFIAFSDFKKKYIQVILFFLGYVSLFCFNARGATLVITLFIVPFFLWKINKATPKSKKWIIKLGVFCMFCAMFYAVTQTPLGGRLMNSEIVDSSSKTRLEVFDFYKYYQQKDDFIWGHPDNYEYMIEKLGGGAAGVENGVIVMILEYGIIFTFPMLILLFMFQYRKLSVYSNLEKWLLLMVFYFIGAMNPNLAKPFQWLFWFYAFYVFRPELHVHSQQTKIISS